MRQFLGIRGRDGLISVQSESLAKAIRLSSLDMVHKSQSSHIGSALSIADILAVLYGSEMKYDPLDPSSAERDRFILSKGHACSAVYAVLGHSGFFPVSNLDQFGENGSRFMTHISHHVPGVEFSTGSLGHGLPFATGKALALKRLKRIDQRVFVLVGDGELDEGSNWEAALFAAHHELNNLILIVDFNDLQSLTTVRETLALEPITKKFDSFGWDVQDVDGHSHDALRSAFRSKSHQPKVIVARTVKGKGVSFMENSIKWHYASPDLEQLAAAHREINEET